jgi:hypothetical protein
MKETIEIRINYEYSNLLFNSNEGKDLGQISKSVKVIKLSNKDFRYDKIPVVSREVKKKYGKDFFYGWKIKRSYSKKELELAKILQLKVKTTFESSGEECGTQFDYSESCEICGVNRKQIGYLKLSKAHIPKKDISRTISGELVVSEKFAAVVQKNKIQGVILKPVILNEMKSNYYQLISDVKLDLSKKTLTGINPWDFSENSDELNFSIAGHDIKIDKEIYKCTKGHLLGLNILSEAFIKDNQSINENDFFESNQKIGVKRGLLYPASILFCSQKLRRIILEEGLTGFDFEVAHIE